ncbi:MAG: SpoIIE family protein phosphatase [Bacteroidia bacterium]|nr:SpoIIE family protein phosphatase [Bacteroidia bacterium]
MESAYFKEQLQAKEDMLAKTTRFLVKIQEDLESKNAELSVANKEIYDSISFASLIQKSLLPDTDILKIFFKDASFKVIQQIGIGGDTVFIKNTNKGVVFGLLDSTGHGVPAALLSISGTLLLKELMSSMEINNPQTLLNLLNYQLHKTFNNSQSSIAHKEGMIFSYSSAENKLTYSSAKGKALLLHRTGEIEELSNTKKSIGDDANSEFELFEIEVREGDKLILYSDGLTDQFGGDRNKKFSRERLKKILQNCIGESASTLVKTIEEEFEIWRNGNKQTDDVSFMVIDF